MEDDRRNKRLQEQKREMREYLDRQVQEKNQRKLFEKQSYHEQAAMWKKDSEEYFNMEDERRNREKQVNLAHAEMLQQQMDEKERRKLKGHMNRHEAKLNRQLLREVKRV